MIKNPFLLKKNFNLNKKKKIYKNIKKKKSKIKKFLNKKYKEPRKIIFLWERFLSHNFIEFIES